MKTEYIKEKLSDQFPEERFPDFHYEITPKGEIIWEDGPCLHLISFLVNKWLEEAGETDCPAYHHTFSEKEKARLKSVTMATVVENEFEKKAAIEKQKREEPNNLIWPVTYEEAAKDDQDMKPGYRYMIWEEIYGFKTGNINAMRHRDQQAKEKQAAFHVVDNE